jgi:hypothetical protein
LRKRQDERIYDAVPVFDDAPTHAPIFVGEQTEMADETQSRIAEGIYAFGTGFLVAWLLKSWLDSFLSDLPSKHKKR